jgi:hypothetical protein
MTMLCSFLDIFVVRNGATSWTRGISVTGGKRTSNICRVSQEERSVFWEVRVSVILSKWVYIYIYIYMCPIPNGFRDKSYLTVKFQNSAPWRRMGGGCTDIRFIDLSTGWRWMVSFTHRPLYRRRKNPQSRSGRRGTLPGLELRPLGRPTRSQSLYRLRYPNCHWFLGCVNAIFPFMHSVQIVLPKLCVNVCYMPCLFHPPSFRHRRDIFVMTTDLIFVLFSAVSCYFLCLRPSYCS